MSTLGEQLDDLARVRYTTSEISLETLVDAMGKRPERYIVKRSRNQPNNWLLWDTDVSDYVLCTYAFVVRYCNPMQTGNFVPESERIPDGLPERAARSDQSRAQWSVTFDLRVDSKFPDMISSLEDWARSSSFNTTTLTRNPWQAPPQVYANLKYSVSSQLFRKVTSFNSKKLQSAVKYKIHPWIAKASIPHNQDWVPNPNVVQVYCVHGDGILKRIMDTDAPALNSGDIVKMSFRIVFRSGPTTWNMELSPVQIIRTMKVDVADSSDCEDHSRLSIPRVGDKLCVVDTEDNDDSSSKTYESDGTGALSGSASPSPESGASLDVTSDVGESSHERELDGSATTIDTTTTQADGDLSVGQRVLGSLAKRKAEDDIDSKRTKRIGKRK